MKDIVFYGEFSSDREYKIYKNTSNYEVWIQRRITDEYIGKD